MASWTAAGSFSWPRTWCRVWGISLEPRTCRESMWKHSMRLPRGAAAGTLGGRAPARIVPVAGGCSKEGLLRQGHQEKCLVPAGLAEVRRVVGPADVLHQ